MHERTSVLSDFFFFSILLRDAYAVSDPDAQAIRMLSHDEARTFYDWFGARQDSQRFYEDPAVSDLVVHADFGGAHSMFEFGCGTGRFAERLLSDDLPPHCLYRAVDISSTMVRLARKRMILWGERVSVTQTSGSVTIAAPNSSSDRFVACYVLDLLSGPDISQLCSPRLTASLFLVDYCVRSGCRAVRRYWPDSSARCGRSSIGCTRN